VKGKYCSLVYDNSKYRTLDAAKSACKIDEKCVAIEDFNCDNIGGLNLCEEIAAGPGIDYCLHKKG